MLFYLRNDRRPDDRGVSKSPNISDLLRRHMPAGAHNRFDDRLAAGRAPTAGGRTTLVYLPVDYARDTSHAFPVVYFLHGYPGNAAQWVGDGAQLPQVLDQLIGEPQEVRLPPLPEAYWTGEHHAEAPPRMTPELLPSSCLSFSCSTQPAVPARFCSTRFAA